MKVISTILVILCCASVAWGGPMNVTRDGVAIDGFDTVAYFESGQATQGTAAYRVEYAGAQWWFVSAAHQQLFILDPERYMPQYAGHCANGLSDGHLVRGNPEIFRIIDDRLYLFYSWWGKAQWKFDQQEQISLANDNWQLFSEVDSGNH